MAISVTHTLVATKTDDPDKEVNKDQWNANHALTGFGSGVETALAINVGSAGAPVLFDGALGTPSSGVGTNLTGTAASLTAGNVTTNANLTGHVTSVGNAAVLGSFSSAQLRTALTDESGTGVAYFQSGDLGTPSAGVGTNLTGTAASLTAGNVTTNANLTGPITSTGNATAVAAQTGTGTTFAMQTAPSFLGGVTIGAGTSTVAPLVMTSGTSLTTAAAGVMEFDGTAFYATAAASSRQVVNTEQYSFAVSDFGLANSASAQAYMAAAQDVLTVQASTLYQFETLIEIEGMGGTTHTTAFSFAGTATFTNCNYYSIIHVGTANAISTAQTTKFSNAATAQVLHPTVVTASTAIWIRGTFAIADAGTIIPQVTFSADPTGTILAKVGTFFRCWPVGSNAAVSVGNWA